MKTQMEISKIQKEMKKKASTGQAGGHAVTPLSKNRTRDFQVLSIFADINVYETH